MIRPTPYPVGRRGGRSQSSRMEAISRSTSASSATGSLVRSELKSLMPLSAKGLWEAETTAPGSRRRAATVATPGVGNTPRSKTSAPSVASPADRAAESMGPERRVSRPTTKPCAGRTRAVARPMARASSAVSSSFATPRTPSVPKRAFATVLPLGVLRSLARLLQAVLLGFLLTGIAGQEAGALERGTVLGVHFAQAAGDPQSHGARLPRDAAPVDGGVDVVGLRGVGDPQRLGQQHAVGGGGEIGLDGLLVDPDRSLAGPEADAGDRLFAASGGLGEWCGHLRSLRPLRRRSFSRPGGPWAARAARGAGLLGGGRGRRRR